ncbi:hypothetical protein ACIGEL_19140 [Rossellomorea aquimaris]|uniref:hypothetical protein n=1 Tax=Rossellomorea aquimaris TaxID=189382 RepID=UPI0037C4F944
MKKVLATMILLISVTSYINLEGNPFDQEPSKHLTRSEADYPDHQTPNPGKKPVKIPHHAHKA